MSNDTTNRTTNQVFGSLWDAPGSRRGFFRIAPDHSLNPLGADLGGRVTVIGARTVPALGLVLQLHVEGGSHWAGRGMARGTHGAQFQTILVERKDADIYRYIHLGDCEIPRNAESRSARTATYVANTLRNMEVPS